MRRILLSVVACCAVIAFVPASALAHGHHKRHHRAHHARIMDFGSTQGTQGTQGTQSGQSNQASGQGQTAGTVQSFTNGVLTIALTDGSTATGMVTSETEIECQAADMSGSSGWQGHDHGGDNSTQGSNSSAQGDDDNGQGDDNNSAAAQTCDTSSLTPGAVVQEAELKISSAGAVWDKVDLASSSSSPSSSTSSSSSGS